MTDAFLFALGIAQSILEQIIANPITAIIVALILVPAMLARAGKAVYQRFA